MDKKNYEKWLKAAGIRALKTMAETVLGLITVGQAFYQIDWINVGSVALTTGILSLLWSIKGLPELEEKEE